MLFTEPLVKEKSAAYYNHYPHNDDLFVTRDVLHKFQNNLISKMLN